jgi:thiamine pyrophosphate-dependent acetolactate synthase large subunit-like protein
MGGHASFALGLALARPNDKVVLFDSEGDLLMNLGILPTIAEQAPANFYHFMLDNECYATTGGQPVPNAKNVAYDVIARGCGYPRAFAFDQLEEFQANITSILGQPGPVFVALKVLPEVENVPIGQRPRWQTRTRVRVLEDLRAELGIALASGRTLSASCRSAEAELEDACAHQRLRGDRQAEHRHDGR